MSQVAVDLAASGQKVNRVELVGARLDSFVTLVKVRLDWDGTAILVKTADEPAQVSGQEEAA